MPKLTISNLSALTIMAQTLRAILFASAQIATLNSITVRLS